MVGIQALSIVQIRSLRSGFAIPTGSHSQPPVLRPKQTETAPCRSMRIAAPSQCSGPHSEPEAFLRTKILLQVSPLAVCLRALDARTGGRYPVGSHDRPLRWLLYM